MKHILYKSKKKALKVSGFLSRMLKKTGQNIINSRRKKKRFKLSFLK
jgi:ribosomal protein L34